MYITCSAFTEVSVDTFQYESVMHKHNNLTRAKFKLSAEKCNFMWRNMHLWHRETNKTHCLWQQKYLARQHLLNIPIFHVQCIFSPVLSIEYVQQHKQLGRIKKRKYCWQKPFSLPFSSSLSTPVYIGHFFLFSFFSIRTSPWSFGVWNSSTLFSYHLIPICFYITSHLFPLHM